MNNSQKSISTKFSSLSFVDFRMLIWIVLILSLLLFSAISYMHFRQQYIVTSTVPHLENFRQARIDLAKGFLHVSLGNDSTSPYSMDQGIALINQAILSFERSSNLLSNVFLKTNTDISNDANLISTFNKNIKAFQIQLKEWTNTEIHSSEQETKLRISFAELDRQAGSIDFQMQSNIIKLFNGYNFIFHGTLLGAALMLLIISGIVIFSGRVKSQSEKALKESEQRWQFALEGSGDGVWDFNLQNNTVYYSPRWKEILGYKNDEINDSFDELKKRIHPNDRTTVVDEMENILSGKIPIFDSEHRLLCKNGQYKWVHVRGKVISRSKEGKPLRIIGTQKDISEKKLIEEEIKKLNSDLEQRVNERTAELQNAIKEIESFSYSVSHDLRAPLRAINGFLKILEEEYLNNIDEEGIRLMNIIGENTKKMGQLIDDLLAFSRIGRMEIQKIKVDTNSMVKSIYQDYTSPALQKLIDFKIIQLPNVSVDSTLFHQVWVNLISNAVKYTSKQAIPSIEIGCNEKNDVFEFYVKDNGIGFDMQYANKLFGVFERLHSSKEFGGTGVGLAIVNRIIVRHGGKIWAKSELGKGATFYFTIPQ